MRSHDKIEFQRTYCLLLRPFSFFKKIIPIWVCPVDKPLFYDELIL